MGIHEQSFPTFLWQRYFSFQLLSSYDLVPEQDVAAFVFHFHWVLPGVHVGDVVVGVVG